MRSLIAAITSQRGIGSMKERMPIGAYIAHLAWRGVLLGLFGGMSLALFGRGDQKRGRKANQPIHAETDSERPPVRDEDRLVEPLGPGVAWGRLDQLEGKYTGVPFMLTRAIIILGRQSGCDVVLDDDRASRYHVVIAWDHNHGSIQDNNSTNGTLTNGQSVKGPMPLRHGDIIEAGGAEFRFTYTEATGLATLDAQPTEKIVLPGMQSMAEQPLPHARLTALTGPEPGRAWPVVSAGVVSIGRGGDNIVVLPHASVSRHHAQLLVQATGLYIQDIGSSNGTSVNGDPLVAPRQLLDSDHIQVGDILLVLKLEAAPNVNTVPLEPPTQHLPSSPTNHPAGAPFPAPMQGMLPSRGPAGYPSAPNTGGAPYTPPMTTGKPYKQPMAPGNVPPVSSPISGTPAAAPGAAGEVGPNAQFRPPMQPMTTLPHPSVPGEKRVPRFRPTRPEGRERGDKPPEQGQGQGQGDGTSQ